MPSEEAKRVEARFLAASLIVFGILAFLVLQEFFYYVIGGLLLVFAFFPIHRRIRRFIRRPGAAAAISFLLVVAVVIGPLVLVGFLVFHGAVDFARSYDPSHLNETIQDVLVKTGVVSPENVTANETAGTSAVANWLGGAIKDFAEKIGSEMVDILPGLAIGLVVSGFTIFYGFVDGETFYSRLRHALPLPDDIEESLFREIRRVTQVVFVGNILVSAFGGIIGALSFLIFGVPDAVFWGFIMIILGILPVVGAPFVWLPAAVWLFINGHPGAGIGVILVNSLIVVGYIDHILRPKLIGKYSNIHPIFVLIGVLGGVQAFGPLGFVIGPLVLAVFIALVRSYTEWHPRWRERRLRGEEQYHPSADIDFVDPPRPPPQGGGEAGPGPPPEAPPPGA